LTREDTHTASDSAVSDAIGPIRNSTPSGRGASSACATPGLGEERGHGKVHREADEGERERREQRAERLRQQQLERGERRREQRLQRSRLLLADDAVGGNRHRRRHRREHQQHQELLEERRLDGGLRSECPRSRLLAIELEGDPADRPNPTALAGEGRHQHRHEHRQQDGDGPGEQAWKEDARPSAQVGESLPSSAATRDQLTTPPLNRRR
jgi:hypothetical protein